MNTRIATSIRRVAGFTLVELLVLIAILGLLAGLVLPAVQSAREAARRTQCGNNLRQLGLGLTHYEAARRAFPPGVDSATGHAWASWTLPNLEQGGLRDQIDFKQQWDDPFNRTAVFSKLSVFICPNTIKQYAGATDYCGIAGTHRKTGNLISDGRNGVLFAVNSSARPVRFAEITDGLSNTISVGEAIAVTEINHGFWACGWHCLTHDDGGVSNIEGGYNEIASLHPGGANVVFCDGSVQFLDSGISGNVISSLCTRAGAELIGEF